MDDIQKEYAEESNLIWHARNELKYLDEESDIVEAYLSILRIFSSMGHSGYSAMVFTWTLFRLMSFQNLTPLTDNPEEWMHHTSEQFGKPGGVWQNIRNGEAFSDDGGKTYTLLSDKIPEGLTSRPKYYSAHFLSNDKLVIVEDPPFTNED